MAGILGSYNWLKISATFTFLLSLLFIFKLSNAPFKPSEEDQKRINGLLDEVAEYNKPICVEAGPFPFDQTHSPKVYPGNGCELCAELAELGLLKVTKREINNSGNVRVARLYELTKLGESLYDKKVQLYSAKDKGVPGFCFAEKMAIYEVKEYLKPMLQPGKKLIGMKYQMQAINANELLFDQRIERIGLKVPIQRSPALFPETKTTVMLYDNDDQELDGSFLYGKYALEK